MACLTVLDGPLKGQRLTLAQQTTRIGRREGNDWVLQDGSVSGTHCEIERSDKGFVIRDLGSTNGTKVNAEPVKESPLFRNDIVQVGEIPIMIEGDDVPNTSPLEPSAIPRTTIIIPPQKRALETPKMFVKKSNSNRVWIAIIVLLLAVIGVMLYLFLKN